MVNFKYALNLANYFYKTASHTATIGPRMETKVKDFITACKVGNQEKIRECVPVFYDILRNVENIKVGNARSMGITSEDIDEWNSKVNSSPWQPERSWSHATINLSSEKISKDYFSYYVTVVKSKENILNVIKGINNIVRILERVSAPKKSTIYLKVNKLIDDLASDSDNIKIFYFDESLKHSIENAVKEWAKNNNIEIGNRFYHHGVEKVIDGKGMTYGMFIAINIARALKKYVTEEGKEKSEEECFEWFKNNFETIINSAVGTPTESWK